MKTLRNYFILTFILISACTIEDSPPLLSIEEEVTGQGDPESLMVLGEKKGNPFTIENVKSALNLLEKKYQKENRRINCSNCSSYLTPTHRYVKFRPQNYDQLAALDLTNYDLWDYPLDVDVQFVGDYYHDPGVGQDGITPFYTLVPYQYPITINVPYDLISEIYLYNEDDGDIQDADPWDPTYPSCIDPTDIKADCPEARKTMINNTTEASKNLDKMGIDRFDLYNLMMELSGNKDEIINPTEQKARISSTNTVAGTIKVKDNSINVDIPLQRVLVKTRRWFKLRRALTNFNGQYSISVNYRKKAIVSVHFTDGSTKLRGINNVWKFWQFAIPIKKTLGEFSTSQLQNVSYTFPYNSNANTNAATQWVAGNTWNTVIDSRNGKLGISGWGTSSLNIWVSSRITQSASAPMLRSVFNTSLLSSAIDFYLLGSTGPIAVAAKKILQNLSPDITLRYSNSANLIMNAAQIKESIYHEMAHAEHYSLVGNNYWIDYISYIVANGGYGNKNSSGSGRIAVAEAWGAYIGGLYGSLHYRSFTGNSNAQLIANRLLDNLELQKPSDASISSYWIPRGLYYDLTDTGEPTSTGVIDNVNLYTPAMIFQSLNGGVLSVGQFKTDLLKRNNNLQITQVNQLIQSYGY
ncbi:hypothetical protein GCM10007049_29570 [Echinicola pacifica]|uniref:Uncharacterized protein n=1 Tax=Echinicola pacifica TaxID=346377 RepID=A0A918Q7B3_9BACT|nr:hypothetical protein [Echinicola pacifica]GGZ34292.1 hypothetical protein GCM10007049_29570 [Echinicola pacifica]